MTVDIFIGYGGRFWKLSTEQWESLCRAGRGGATLDLKQYRPLRARPPWLLPHPDQRSFYRAANARDRLYFEPQDWTPEDFEEALEELAAQRGSGDL